jgi:hypothetical protein
MPAHEIGSFFEEHEVQVALAASQVENERGDETHQSLEGEKCVCLSFARSESEIPSQRRPSIRVCSTPSRNRTIEGVIRMRNRSQSGSFLSVMSAIANFADSVPSSATNLGMNRRVGGHHVAPKQTT